MIYIQQLLSNNIIIVSIASWAIAQIIKMILDVITTGEIDWELMVASGGMPSSHSSFVCALATSVGIKNGFDSSLFAMCFVLAVVVMYDAAGVRRAAGFHAVIINKIMAGLNIKDENVYFYENCYSEELIKNTKCKVFHGYLTYTPKYCDVCGIINKSC